MKSILLTLVLTLTLSLTIGCSPKADSNNNQNALQTQKAIIDGRVITNEPIAKHIVGLVDTESMAICTGSIIHERFILTAAHCIPKDKTKLFIHTELNIEKFDFDEDDPFKNYTGTLLKAKNITVHESYIDADTQGNEDLFDFAVVEIDGKLPSGFEPIPLLTDKSLLPLKTEVTVIGYGASFAQTEIISLDAGKKFQEHLDKIHNAVSTGNMDEFFANPEWLDLVEWSVACNENVQTPEEASQACMAYTHQLSGTLRIGEMLYMEDLNSSELVFLSSQEGGGSCSGDSGGPAIIQVDEQFYQIGVASRGDITCYDTMIYGSVSAPEIQAWISNIISK